MHIAPEVAGAAAAHSAESEATTWLGIARSWAAADHPEVWGDVPGDEASVVGFYDPTEDLHRRMRTWSYEPAALDLADLARFASGLAQAEAEAWRADKPHIATQAYEERRFLMGDRILHWSVPWLAMVGRWYPTEADLAHETRRRLLELGDVHRPAPALSGTEGLVVPGFDGFGPIDAGVSLPRLARSVWSGLVLSTPQLSEIRHARLAERRIESRWLGEPATRRLLAAAFRAGSQQWDSLAADHPGSAQLWRDLSLRAYRTAALFEA